MVSETFLIEVRRTYFCHQKSCECPYPCLDATDTASLVQLNILQVNTRAWLQPVQTLQLDLTRNKFHRKAWLHTPQCVHKLLLHPHITQAKYTAPRYIVSQQTFWEGSLSQANEHFRKDYLAIPLQVIEIYGNIIYSMLDAIPYVAISFEVPYFEYITHQIDGQTLTM